MRVAVIGHVEWVEFLRLRHVPVAGEIVHTRSVLQVPAGGGGVAAVQLARWLGSCRFYTAVGDDELGRRTRDELERRGVEVCSVARGTQRRCATLIDDDRERTIIVIGERTVPHLADPLPWDELATFDAVYLTGGDVGAVRAARAAPVVVSAARIVPLLREAAIELDALIGSAVDAGEQYNGEIQPPPRLVVRTEGGRGGSYERAGTRHRYAAVPVASSGGNITGDTYGAGDTFAAALTLALGQRMPPDQAMAFAAGKAVEVLAYTGPYPG